MDKKLNEVTKVTDMAYVPVIMADGSIGQIAKSDLASVVAGMFKSSSSIMKDYGGAPGSCNDYTENGIRFVYGGTATDYPFDNPYGILITNKTYYPALQSTYINQTFVRNGNRGIYTRFKEGNNDWTDWVRVDNFGYNSLAELAGGVAEQVKNSQWVNLESLYLGDSTDPWVVIKNHFESEFQKSNDYSFVTVGTSAGAEAGCIMFKHTSSTINYGLMFSRRVGVFCLQRDSSATWLVKEVLSV